MGKIGIIGGSGLYDIEVLKDKKYVDIETPFGSPSDKFITGRINSKEVVFLARHGQGHSILPSELNFKANVYGMKLLGVERILSVSAVGSLKKEIKPGDIVIPDQFFDHTRFRPSTFFGKGIVCHSSLADPICMESANIVFNATQKVGAKVHKGGVYICIEGPHFSTRAESNVYRSWGMDIIGMTNFNEAKLAREAEMCYVTIALSTDYDCWYEEEENVTADSVLEIIKKNVTMAKKIVAKSIEMIPDKRQCSCINAIENAIITDPKVIPDKIKKDLNLLIGKYIR
jgi:5'-methylthioadenosine phosphorylase